MKNHRFQVIVGLILAAAASRLAPHPPNFTAVGAIALFAGATISSRWLALVVPLLAMALTDLVLGLSVYGIGRAFEFAAPVYVAMLLTVLVGRGLGRAPLRVACGSVLATAIFFVVSNTVFWMVSGLYPLDASGLVTCYAAALPFAVNMLLGNVVYAASMFGLLAFAESRLRNLQGVRG